MLVEVRLRAGREEKYEWPRADVVSQKRSSVRQALEKV